MQVEFVGRNGEGLRARPLSGWVEYNQRELLAKPTTIVVDRLERRKNALGSVVVFENPAYDRHCGLGANR